MKERRELLLVVNIVVFLAVVLIWLINQPINVAPDEIMRYQIPQFIFERGYLPYGGDPAIRSEVWGISYGFMPFLSNIFSALLMKLISIFTLDPKMLLIAARSINLFWAVGTSYFVIKIARKLLPKEYRWMYVTLIVMLPQFIFLHTYINNDAFAIFCTSMVFYSWILGAESKWDIKSRTLLAVGVAFCALSYYNAYGVILCSIFYYLGTSNILKKGVVNRKEEVYKLLYIVAIVFVLAGWWFIRNLIIYNGDLLALKSEAFYAEKYAVDIFKPSNRTTLARDGVGFLTMMLRSPYHWAKLTFVSFIGVFEGMTLLIDYWIYIFYFGVFIIAIFGLVLKIKKELKKGVTKERLFFHGMMLLSIIIPIILSIIYSYFSDFQPQGRYLMPMLIPFMYYITLGISELIERARIRHPIIGAIGIYALPTFLGVITLYVFIKIIVPLYC